jgi:hypothetical protein
MAHLAGADRACDDTMLRRLHSISLMLLASATGAGACRSTSSDLPPPPDPLPALPSATEAMLAAVPSALSSAPKADPIALGSLEAGLAAMRPRITAEVEPVAKITVTGHARLFLHPGDTKSASVEFDTKGLSSLELSPFIEDLGANPDCAGPKAGIVRLSWSTDAGNRGALMVDRSYTGTVAVDLAKSSRLTLEVDEGNRTTLCDWFSVGILNVK